MKSSYSHTKSSLPEKQMRATASLFLCAPHLLSSFSYSFFYIFFVSFLFCFFTSYYFLDFSFRKANKKKTPPIQMGSLLHVLIFFILVFRIFIHRRFISVFLFVHGQRLLQVIKRCRISRLAALRNLAQDEVEAPR